jgi:aminoglycoside phosphotransferase (APT) family kinase protein
VGDDTAELRSALAAVLGAGVADLRRLTGGASRQTWSAHTVGDDGQPERRVILQRQRPGPGLDAQPADMAGEASLVRAAAEAGVPVANVIAACGDADLPAGAQPLGAAWLLMDHVDGETIARRLLRDDTWAQARSVLLDQAAAALAAVHRIPLSAAPHLQRPDPIERFRGALDLIGEPHPALELGLRWLDANRPPAVESRVVHGDYRLGNWIVDDHGLAAVVDWELAHLGDPAEDLGWLCVRAWRFGNAEPAAGLGSREALLAAYRDAGGADISLDTLRWWEALGTLAWAVICMVQAGRHRSGATRSVELAAIGRRVCENEHDLLGLLPGPSQPTADGHAATAGHPDAPHDLPTAVELLDAVGGFLRNDVIGATEGQVQFHARVAANVVDQLRRQWELGGGQAAAHADRLRRLGFADDRALAAAIRAGKLDERLDEVKTAVWATILDKLAVANPKYA